MSTTKTKANSAKSGKSTKTAPLHRANQGVLGGSLIARDGVEVKNNAFSVFEGIQLSPRLQKAIGPMMVINITNARAQIPKMVRSSADGKVFVIGSAKSPDTPSAVLIGMAEFERVVKEATKPVPSRTFGELRASLPFSGMKLRPLLAEPLPNDGLPVAFLPR